jgi:ribonuclease J
LKITIHRGCNEIGGSCVELQNESDIIFLDFGMPLLEKDGNQFDMKSRVNLTGPGLVEAGVLPNINGTYKWQSNSNKVMGLLLSHYHSDHSGFASYLHPKIPIYAGEPTHRLLELNALFTGSELFSGPKTYFEHQTSFSIGSFRITPYTVDHSAFDAYAFLIEAGGKCLLYSGDLRDHGRKKYALPELLKALAGKTIDALILEGTMLSNITGNIKTEVDLEKEIASLLRGSDSIALAYVSAHNIDRLVTFYRAAKRSNRLFVVDVYTANVLELFGNYASIPYPSSNFDKLKVFYPRKLTSLLVNGPNQNLAFKFKKYKITHEEITSDQRNIVMIVRPSMKEDLEKIKVKSGANFIYSIWEGSQVEEKNALLINYTRKNKMVMHNIHTSGHASVATLRHFVSTLNPKMVIPIHTMAPENYSLLGVNLKPLQDGELLNL